MSVFDQALSLSRQAQTRRGDTLMRVAARELGDASQWHALAAINQLVPPYMTDDAEQAGDGVLLAGQDRVVLPGGTTAAHASADLDALFGRDVRLDDSGRLAVADGDLATVGGYRNLAQALRLALDTTPGDLLFHLTYGCNQRQLIGDKPTPARIQIAAAFVERSIVADRRISAARDVTGALDGDVVRFSGTAVAADGFVVPVPDTGTPVRS